MKNAWKMCKSIKSRIKNAANGGYLQTCALVWERWAEKGGDDAHDSLGNVSLQNRVSVFTVTCVIAHLKESWVRDYRDHLVHVSAEKDL